MPDPQVERSKSARLQRFGLVVRLYLLLGDGSSPEQEGEQWQGYEMSRIFVGWGKKFGQKVPGSKGLAEW